MNNQIDFTNAIKVNSVAEEYEIVSKLFPDCTQDKQNLVIQEDKYYDVLHCTKPNGEQVSYIFDITSFFGKWED